MESHDFDVAVVGLGAMGSAALAHLAARGVRAIGFEARFPAHGEGSSHGDTRLIRLGYFEDPSYVPLLRRAYENWRALEAATGADLLTITGVLQIGRPDSGIVAGTLASCAMHGLAHEVLGPDAMAARYPVFGLDADEVAVFEPEGGFLKPEAAVFAHLKVAALSGAVLRIGERVEGIAPGDGGVVVATAHSRVRVKTVVIATGAWIGQLVPTLSSLAVPTRQVVAWYAPRAPETAALGAMPVFLRDEGDGGSFFGFPAIGKEGVKVGRHAHFREPIDPDQPNPPVNAADLELLDGFIARRLPLAAGRRQAAVTCRYTMLPGEDFLVDLLPSEPNVVVASPCSGHGFKFASVIGEALADLAVEGGTRLPIDAFSFAALKRKTG